MFSILFLFSFSFAAADEQFTHWYPFYRGSITGFSAAQCFSNYTQGSFPSITELYGYSGVCKSMVACLLKHLNEMDKSDMASASLLLGLTPTILGFLGPTTAEIALLSSHRPILAALLSLGAPSISIRRALEFDDPADYLAASVGKFVMKPVHGLVRMLALSSAQYVLTIMAVANVISNSFTLGSRTIISWKCSWQSAALTWSSMTLVPHILAAASLRFSKRASQTPASPVKASTLLPLEVRLCANHPSRPCFSKPPVEHVSVIILSWMATLLGYVHLIFGTLIFSSTLFIGTLDALWVISRYFVSAILCRGIMLVELSGLRAPTEDNDNNARLSSTLRRNSV